jgi:hypothetical protein
MRYSRVTSFSLNQSNVLTNLPNLVQLRPQGIDLAGTIVSADPLWIRCVADPVRVWRLFFDSMKRC